MNSYFIQGLKSVTIIIYLDAQIVPILTSGSPLHLDCVFLACPCYSVSTSLISDRSVVFSKPQPEISHSPGSSGIFQRRMIFGNQDVGTLVDALYSLFGF